MFGVVSLSFAQYLVTTTVSCFFEIGRVFYCASPQSTFTDYIWKLITSVAL
jgi:hypothetical protein